VSGSSGSGNGTVGYRADANLTLAARSATLTVGGIRIGVTQAALVCTYVVNPTSDTADAGGDTGSITITTQAPCAWTASSQASWITITSNTSGLGNATVTYRVDKNTTNSQRSGQLVVAGQTVTVTQKAPKK
jgi:hypothetical protein